MLQCLLSWRYSLFLQTNKQTNRICLYFLCLCCTCSFGTWRRACLTISTDDSCFSICRDFFLHRNHTYKGMPKNRCMLSSQPQKLLLRTCIQKKQTCFWGSIPNTNQLKQKLPTGSRYTIATKIRVFQNIAASPSITNFCVFQLIMSR